MHTTRERILVATNELFRVHGYNGTSLSQISKASDATMGSIYHFFPGGKEELTVAVIESTGATYRTLFDEIAAAAATPIAAIGDFFEGAASVLEATDYLDLCPIGTIAREVASTSTPLRQAADRAFDSWIEAASRELVAAGFAPSTATELAGLFVATLEGGFVLCRTQRSPQPLLAAARHLTTLLEASLAAEPVDSSERS